MDIEFKGFREVKDDYFLLSGIRESKKLKHSPFVIFRKQEEAENGYIVELCDSLVELVKYPLETNVIAQWRGQYSSDYFQFKVEDVIDYIARTEKKDYHVI